MKKTEKNVKNNPFWSLDEDKRTFVKLTVDADLSNKELTVATHKKREGTMSDWRKSDWYQKAREAYIKLSIDGKHKTHALRTLVDLLDAKSEMVKLQAATALLKMTGMFSDNSTPELDQARIRKANADARVAEARAKAMEDNGQDMELLLDKMLNTLTKEDEKNGDK